MGHFEAVTNWDRARWTVDPKLKESIGVPGLKQARARMNDLRDLLKKHEVNLTVAVYPWPDQIAAKDKDSVQVRYWRKWASEKDVKFVNLFPPFFRHDMREVIDTYFAKFDFHYNMKGHALIAETFLKKWTPKISR